MPGAKAMHCAESPEELLLPPRQSVQASQLGMHHHAPIYESSVDSNSLLPQSAVPSAASLSMRSVSPCQAVTNATEPPQADPLNHVLTDMQSPGTILPKLVRPVDAGANMNDNCSSLQTASAVTHLISGTGISSADVVDHILAELIESSIHKGLMSELTDTPVGEYRRISTLPQQAFELHDSGMLPAILHDDSTSFLSAAGGASPEGCAAFPNDTDTNEAAALNSSAQFMPPAVNQASFPQDVQQHQEASTGAAAASASAEGERSGLHSLGWVLKAARVQHLLPSLWVCNCLLLLLLVSVLL